MSDSYDEEIRFLDDQIGTLLADLRKRGLYEETLLIVISDHGEEFLEHGEIAHATSLYDVLLRIPLIVKFPCPGPHCGHRTVDRQVEILDLMPTVLELAGLPPPSGIQGRSLLHLPGPDDRTVAVGAYGEFVSLRTAGFKYIASPGDQTEELYDLRADPGETRNLISERPSVAASFRSRLQSWRDALPDATTLKRATATIDEQTRKALEALGYAQ
jgi:arylsulfatase A-like enzyme